MYNRLIAVIAIMVSALTLGNEFIVMNGIVSYQEKYKLLLKTDYLHFNHLLCPSSDLMLRKLLYMDVLAASASGIKMLILFGNTWTISITNLKDFMLMFLYFLILNQVKKLQMVLSITEKPNTGIWLILEKSMLKMMQLLLVPSRKTQERIKLIKGLKGK